jgi:aspartate/methionine/tyrosine aminotransferase
MKIKPFKLERYFAKHEFTAPYLLCCSDCEPLPMEELLEIADEESKRMWHDLKLGYTESQGHPTLRNEISKLYQNIEPEDVMVLAPEEGIYIAMNTLLKKDDHVITTFPGYQSLYEIAYSIGCKVSHWKPREKNRWFFDINDLESLIEEKTRLLVINFPHNPTGATISQNELEKIIEIAERNNIFLFSDEMYRFLEYKPANRTASACDLSEKAISLFGMSKSFALAGLRIGWLTTKNHKLFSQIAAFKDYTTICNSAPSEILAIMALKSKNKIVKRNLEIIKSNLKLLDDFFEKYKQLFEWYKPKAGPIAFPKLKEDINVSEFCADLIEKEGVLLLPSDQYDYEGNNFRIGFARRNMREALDKLEKYINKE